MLGNVRDKALDIDQCGIVADHLVATGRATAVVAVASVAGSAPATAAVGAPADALFRWTSGSKCAVAALALVALSSGKLRLDDRLATFFPELERFDDVETLHLLNHTSGFRELIPQFAREPVLADVVQMVLTTDDAKIAPAGSPFYTGSTSFWLLSGMIERAYGEPVQALCDRFVFAPCGMSATTFGLQDPARKTEVVPLQPLAGETNVRPSRYRVEWACPPSGVVGPVQDAHRLIDALLLARVGSGPLEIDRELARAATEGTRPSTFDHAVSRHADFGYGFMIDVGDRATGSWDQSSFGHVGGFGGSTVFALIADPSRQAAVAIGMGGMAAAPGGFIRWIRLGNALIADIDAFSILEDAAILAASQPVVR